MCKYTFFLSMKITCSLKTWKYFVHISICEISGHSIICLTLFSSMHFETYLKKIEILRFTRCKRRKGGKRYIGIRDKYQRDMSTAKSIKQIFCFWLFWQKGYLWQLGGKWYIGIKGN